MVWISRLEWLLLAVGGVCLGLGFGLNLFSTAQGGGFIGEPWLWAALACVLMVKAMRTYRGRHM